jgi:hypothetical protein
VKSGSLNLLEPSGPVQACNGIALPLPLPERVQGIFLRTRKWLNTQKILKIACVMESYIGTDD